LDAGGQLAVDESSVACRSKYGRHFIFFNSTKPGGKYHFRFYLLCKADFYNCLQKRVATRDGTDKGDGYIPNLDVIDEDNEDNLNTTTKLVLDLCKPIENTGCVVNMDNYYTSPELFIELRKRGLFARGTI